MYPLVFAGLIVIMRRRFAGAPRTLWVDGITAALAAASVSAAVIFQSVLSTADGRALSVATDLAYPLGDLLLMGLVVAALALNRWRVDRTWVLLGLGIALFCAADSLYLVGVAQGWYKLGSAFDAGWWLGFLLIAAAAWQRPGTEVRDRPREGARTIALPLGFGSVGLAVLVFASLRPVNPLAVGLAAASLISVMVRLVVTFRMNVAMLRASRHEALFDPLTALGNRRRLALDLEAALPRADDGSPLVLVLFDLDGFKHYNDSFGHPAGDGLLTRLGAALNLTLQGRGRAYRMGGDEFCALIDPGREVAKPIIDAAAAALSEHGDGFSIRCSHGSVVMPREAADTEEALRMADHRLYANKNSGRASAGSQSRDVLLRALAERHPDLGHHLNDVAELAEATARQLGLPDAEIEEIRKGAALHDVGKVAVPDAILSKPGPLDDAERAFIHRHTLIGERIIASAPALGSVATLVRSTHERFDGAGYPDGLTGAAIPLGSRVIAVCDAFDAMVAERAYRPPMSIQLALEELRRHAGTQFDAVVVSAFCKVADERRGLVAADHRDNGRATPNRRESAPALVHRSRVNSPVGA
jgi:diguanylate cyclase (GGDEF)-like protein/putative nucleotidyltransferase with HDIG domain